MTKIFLLFSIFKKAIIERRSACLVFFVLHCLIPTSAYAQLSSCQIENSYFVIESKDIISTSNFFKKVELLTLNEDIPGMFFRAGALERNYKYFDTYDQRLLALNRELVLIETLNLPEYREDKKKLIFSDINAGSEQSSAFKVRQYNRKNSPVDKHELFGQVRRKERPILDGMLQNIKVEALDMVNILEVDVKEELFQIQHYEKGIAELSLGEFHIDNFGLPNVYSILKFEINLENLNSLESEEANAVKDILCDMKNGFKSTHPKINELSYAGYYLFDSLAKEQFPLRMKMKRSPVVFKLTQVFILVVLCALVLFLFLGRYSKSENYKYFKSVKGK